jgi:tetratricopeptide (TPR) repeat protein
MIFGYRIHYLPLLITTGICLFGGSVLHAQSLLKTYPHDIAIVSPLQNEENSTTTLENKSGPQPKNGLSDLKIKSSIFTQQLLENFQLYKNLLANDMTAEADTVAKRIVDLSIKETGFKSTSTAKALTNLAIVQSHNKEYIAAQQNYEAAIGIIEQVEDRLNSALINPLHGLGAVQLASNRPDLALDTFTRAQHINHVNKGPHNFDQVKTLESLAEIYISSGEIEKAHKLHNRIYALHARKYDTNSENIMPILYKRAEWQHRLRLYDQERSTYRKIINIIEKNKGKQSLTLIRPLTGLANAYLYNGALDRKSYPENTITTGELYLKRAIHLTEEHSDSTWEIRENALLSLADFYLLSKKTIKARRLYQNVWDLLSEDASRFINRYNHLEVLVLLQDINPPIYYGANKNKDALEYDDQFERGKVVTKFMVNTRGRVKNLEVIEMYPLGLTNIRQVVLKEMKRLIYRPRLENRRLVNTENMTYTHEFFYRQSDLASVDKIDKFSSPTADDVDEVAVNNSGK